MNRNGYFGKSGAERRRGRGHLAAFLIAAPISAALGFILVHSGLIDPRPGFFLSTTADVVLGLSAVAFMVRISQHEKSAANDWDASRRRLAVEFEHRALSIRRETEAQAQALEAAKQRVQAANERLQFALRSSGYGIWETHLATGRLDWDDRMHEIYGLRKTDFGGTLDEWVRLIHPDDLKALLAQREHVMSGKVDTFDSDFRIIRPDGAIRHVEAHGMAIAGPEGSPARFVGLNRDITARKKLEERLRRSEAVSIQVSRLARIGQWDVSGPTRELRWDPELFRICGVELGYEPSLARMAEFFPEPHRAAFLKALDQTLQEGTSFDLEFPFDTGQGGQRWVRVLGQAEFLDRTPIGLFGALQDITSRRQAEDAHREVQAQLFQVQKMDTLGTLAGGIAHDFNNLLTGIIGYQDLAADLVPESHPARACLNQARRASSRAAALVDQILLYSRKSDPQEHVPVVLAAAVEDAVRFLRSTIPATIRIESKVAPGCGRILADPDQMKQLLMNLGTNAAQAMAAGGVLTIALEPVEGGGARGGASGILAAGPHLRLSVTDTGHGMDAQTQKKAFDPFFTTRPVGEGRGLGLSIVQGIVQSHGGAIELSSQVGAGTTVRVHFPVTPAAAEAARPVVPIPRGNGELVAVVDDEPMVADATKLGLETFGYRTEVFSTPAECLEQFRRDAARFALLITDQTMPAMTGVELARAVRALAPTLPILLMSGYFSKVAAGALEELGAVSLLAKPFTPLQLMRAARSALHPEA